MASNGWTVPDGRDPAKLAAAGAAAGAAAAPALTSPTAAAAAAAPSAAALAAGRRTEQAMLVRTSECAFARSQAAVSSIAATRAKACDYECEEALRLSPGAPRPASCPPENMPKYAKGNVD